MNGIEGILKELLAVLLQILTLFVSFMIQVLNIVLGFARTVFGMVG